MTTDRTARRVLIVDDHAGFRATLRRVLESDGWTVIGEAADGSAAIRMAAALHPDVVVLDIGLPDIDGFEVNDRLAALGGGDAPAVVLVSSRDARAYGDRVATSTARGFVAKGDLDGRALGTILAAGR
jgi:DNA-binding NarL/FixJ family response regulator